MSWSALQAAGLQFRHTDNINHWRNAMTTLGLPAVSQELTNHSMDKLMALID